LKYLSKIKLFFYLSIQQMMIHLYGMEYLPTYVYTFASIILQFSTHIIDTRDFLYLISFPYITSLLYLGSKTMCYLQFHYVCAKLFVSDDIKKHLFVLNILVG